jgi:hypothetical protein
MAQSSGQNDPTIRNRCSKTLESSKRYVATPGQSASRITERNSAKATHAVLPRGLQASTAAPPSLQKVASVSPTLATPVLGWQFPEYMYCPIISASYATLFLGSTYMSNQEQGDRHVQDFIGEEFWLLPLPPDAYLVEE